MTGIGEALNSAREEQGRSVEDVARSLRLRSEQVRALEEERFGSFGGDVYARGFLKSYALELGMDPQPLLDTYRREVSGDDDLATAALVTPSAGGLGGVKAPRGTPPRWLAWAVAAIAVVVGLGLLGQLTGSRTPEIASPDTPPAATGDDPSEGDDPDDGEDDGPTLPDPDDEPEPEPEPIDGVELLLALEEDSWLRVTIDGTVVLEQVVEAGQTLPYNGDDEITVRFGNAGGVRVEMNGQDFGVPGGRGQVEEVTFTPDTDPGDV